VYDYGAGSSRVQGCAKMPTWRPNSIINQQAP
jgi:hypothetical protein